MPAVAADDSAAPVATGISVSPSAVDTSGADAEFHADVEAGDDLAGVSRACARFAGPGGAFDQCTFQLYSGTRTDGVFRIHYTAPRYKAQGTYALAQIVVFDSVDNIRTYNEAQLASAGLQASISIQQDGPADTEAPKATGISVSPSAVDTSGADAEFHADVEAGDDLAGVSRACARFAGPGGAFDQCTFQLYSGTRTDGVFRIHYTAPRYKAQGVYKLTEIVVFDTLETIRSYHEAELNAEGLAASIEIRDLTPPALVIESGPSGPTADTTPTFSFMVDAGATVECSIDQGVADFGACAEAAAETPPSPLNDGDYTFRVRASDASDNAVEATRSFSIDTHSPETQIDSHPPSIASDPTPTFTFSGGEDAIGFDCRIDSTEESAFAPCTSGASLTSLSDGEHMFEVRAADVAGNVDTTPPSFTFTVDTDLPGISIDSGPAGPTGERRPLFGFTAEAGASVQCSIDQGTPQFRPCASADFDQPPADLPDGSYIFRVKATDAAQNAAVATRSFQVRDSEGDQQQPSGDDGQQLPAQPQAVPEGPNDSTSCDRARRALTRAKAKLRNAKSKHRKRALRKGLRKARDAVKRTCAPS